jgi:peptidyl-tRNA hydrolase
LGKWDKNELPIIKSKIDKSVECVESFVLQGLAATMNMANKLEFS